jgi:pre-rRNA-processing protein IPI1
MTHLASDIRIFALDVLEWLLRVAGDEVVSCAGGWVKMLKCFLGLLGWQNGGSSGKWSVTQSFGKAGGDAKVQTKHHVISERSNAYAHLNLFGAARDEEAEMYEDREDRQRVFHERAEAAVVAGVEQAIKGGGELGRAAAALRKAVKEGMADYNRDTIN